MIYVITSLVNGWDNLRPPLVETIDVRFICFTNNPHQPRVDPWEFRPVYDVGLPSRTARVPKILPHLMLPEDAEYSIWHDANFQLTMAPQWIMQETLAHHDWAAFHHPGRRCIYAEGEHCMETGIGTKELLAAELERYRQHFPEHNRGLWANGFLVRRHSDRTKALCERWWSLYQDGGERDQISFPIARRMESLEIFTIGPPETIWKSRYAHFNFHAAWVHRDRNEDYLPERAHIRERLRHLSEVTRSDSGIRWPAQ